MLLGIALLPGGAVAAPGGGGDGIRQPQGRKLQGGVETPSYVAEAPAKLTAVTAFPAQLAGRNDVAGKALLFRVTGKFVHTSAGKGTADTDYAVQVADRSDAAPVWRNLCSATDAANRALAVEGYWDAQGNHQPHRSRFTFACTDGLIAKCIDWTYRPEKVVTRQGRTVAGVPAPVVPLFPYHQAFTRMGRADYCGTGQPNTVEGTYVFFYDDINQVPYPANNEPAGFFQEGGWTAGPACCLSKKRWATLPLNGPCASALPDPRAPVVAGRMALFCEDIRPPAGQPCRPGTVNTGGLCLPTGGGACQSMLFNHSEFLDVGLYRWQNRAGDSLTTTAGFWGGARSDATEPPMAGFDKAEYEGTVYRSEKAGPNLVGVEHADVARIPLVVLEGKTASGARDLLTTSPPRTFDRNGPFPGYKEIGRIGWIFPAGKSDANAWRRNTALYLHVDAQGRHLTTTRASVPGYTMQSLIGYLPALPTP